MTQIEIARKDMEWFGMAPGRIYPALIFEDGDSEFFAPVDPSCANMEISIHEKDGAIIMEFPDTIPPAVDNAALHALDIIEAALVTADERFKQSALITYKY